MKKKPFIISALACAAILSASASKNADPVLMTINGKDVRQSEFEYLYHKNNLQQLAPQSIDEYIEMFIVYKLKVADAEAAGLHQTDAFTKEFNGYCAELSRPYLRDTIVEKRLIEEAYGRMATSRKVSHIMLPLGSTYDEKEANRMKLDSIRTAIVNGSADFGEMAVRYSSDRSARVNNGSMGYINVNSYPYPFEKTAWETPVGEISPVIEDAPFGFHIIRVEDERPNPGKVEARHILKLTNGLSEEEGAAKKAQIDSIYNLLVSGGDFDAIARAESEDPGSAANGGRLGWFGPGEMVKEFEDAAFGLKDGGISAPFKTAYGYHIVQTLAHRGIGTLAEESERIKAAISRDMRSVMPETERLTQLKAELGVKIDSTGLMQARSRMTGDSPAEQLKSLQTDNTLIATVGNRTISIGDVINYIPSNVLEGANDAFTVLNSGLENKINETVVEETRKNLAENNSEYRNLTNEYRDGILLFEISNRNVWERSASDTEGLQKFFSANRAKYTWDKPHYKGYVIFATNDSIAGEAQKYLAANQVENDSLVSVMRANYGRNIKIEKVVTGKGENAIVDNVAFNGERPEAPGRWTAWFGYTGRVIDTPEEANDVRGAVASDYQQQLESEWIKDLRKKYKIKLNKKALKALGN
ncbi:peptidylprolyl isomerase [Duncaniella muris]|jgi:peptidyl-prolyl cis-trans isomerase SurA|uniref:peptidylprolyl isomerase n=1 Tax=Duncaniella muris TaxID=2094150 RepID=UPI0026748376|nr:peptidylprolyl isomerase [Duncaniella muris]